MKKIINYKNLSIGKKFTVTFCLWLLVPLLLMFLWINKSVTDQIVEENCKTRLEILKQTEYGITNMIENVTSVSLDIIGDGEIQNYLKISDTEDEEADNLKNDIAYNLGKITSLKTYLSRISIFTEEKIVFQTGKYMVEEKAIEISDVAQQEGRIVWDAAKKDENYLLSRDRDNYEVSAYRAIVSYYDFENVLAYERITIDEDYICSIYSGIATDTTEQFFIINKQGEIISSLNKELLGKPYGEEAVLKKVIHNKEGYYIDQDKQLVVSYYCLPKVQWYVVKIDRQEEIIGQGLLKTITLVCMFLSMAVALPIISRQEKLKQTEELVCSCRNGKLQL